MSCKSQVLREHCAGQVIQQLNEMSPWLDVLSTPVWHDCRATVQLGQQLTRPFRQSYGLFYGFKLSVQPNYVKKNNQKRNFFIYLFWYLATARSNLHQQLSSMSLFRKHIPSYLLLYEYTQTFMRSTLIR